MLIINAKILTMRGKTIENGYLLVEDGKIRKFGKMDNIPSDYSINEALDLNGKILMPGFVDAHSHLGMSEDGVGDEGEDINEMSEPCTPQIRAIDAIDPYDRSIEEARNAGVTTFVASPGSSNPIAGQICIMKTFGRTVEEMMIKDNFAMKFALGENPKRIYGTQDQTPMSRMATAALIRENLLKAKHHMLEFERYENENDSFPELDFKSDALIPVLKGEMQAHFHAHRAYDILTAIRISKEFDLDYVIVHATEGHMIADILSEEKAPVICGPILGTRSKPELSRQSLENCAVLFKNGVEAAISTDHPEVPAQFLPLSASIVSNHGFGDENALLSITYWAAKAIGVEDRVGSIAEGLDADLLIFEIDPLDVKAKPVEVFINGKATLGNLA